MLFNPTPSSPPKRTDEGDERRLMVDLEAAQRRDIYTAGRGDGFDRSRRRRLKLALRRR
jgi:hypothetical protein